MRTPYKALQSKALHQGLYIGYVVAGGDQWTTNGHMMIRDLVLPDETKPLKDQLEHRHNGKPMPDMTQFIDSIEGYEIRHSESGTTKTGTSTMIIKSQSGVHTRVQKLYMDYVYARFGHEHNFRWYVSGDGKVFAQIDAGVKVAIIAPVKEDA